MKSVSPDIILDRKIDYFFPMIERTYYVLENLCKKHKTNRGKVLLRIISSFVESEKELIIEETFGGEEILSYSVRLPRKIAYELDKLLTKHNCSKKVLINNIVLFNHEEE